MLDNDHKLLAAVEKHRVQCGCINSPPSHWRGALRISSLHALNKDFRLARMRGTLLALGIASCVLAVFSDNATFPEIRQLDLASFSNAQAWRNRGIFGLHIGCGLSLPAMALNTDIEGIAVPGKGQSTLHDPLVAIDVADDDRRYFLQHNALQPFPLAPGSFDWIYSEHFIEHVSRDGAVTLVA